MTNDEKPRVESELSRTIFTNIQKKYKQRTPGISHFPNRKASVV